MHPVCCSKGVAEAIFSSASLSLWSLLSQKWFHVDLAAASHHPSSICQLPHCLGYLQWDGIYWMTVRSVDYCSGASDEISISIFLVLGFHGACMTDKASENMTALGCVASFCAGNNLAAACRASAFV